MGSYDVRAGGGVETCLACLAYTQLAGFYQWHLILAN